MTFVKRSLDDFAPPALSRATTTGCSAHDAHPEFVLYYDTPPVTPDAVQWLIHYLETSVASGERYKPGETMQIGWMITQLADEDGLLCICEPDFRSAPLRWVPSVTQTLVDLFMQQFTAQSAGFEDEIDVPNWYQVGVTCSRFGEDPLRFCLQRAPGIRHNPQDSGWFCGCMFVDCDHDNMENLRLASLYELAVMNRSIVEFLALPESCDIVVTTDGVEIGRYGQPVKMLPHK
jgi:hypothetical protein